MNSYNLSRSFVDFAFENPSKIKPNHYALFFFAIEHCNRLGWKKEFGLPTTMTMEAIGIKSYNTYINTFTDLESFGFIKVIQKSKNQYSSNIIALLKFNKALDKALDKAFIKHESKQSESLNESIYSINKPINKEPINKEPINKEFLNSVCDFFSQTTEPLERKVWGFMNGLRNRGKFNEFENQTKDYMKYKKISEERIHSWNGYEIEWDSADWSGKLKKVKPKKTNAVKSNHKRPTL